ncbi:MAG: type I methionyl aminopeptidase [Alphaproteobacteria bacterium]
MTISSARDLDGLGAIGRIVAQTLAAMGNALEPGMTTLELDRLGRAMLEEAGARSAPELCYGFPGATCISVNEAVAHGVPGPRPIRPGDLVNIDVSAEKGGYFADTGGSFAVPPVSPRAKALCRDGRRALWEGIRAVRPGVRLNRIGARIEGFATRNGYSLIRNLASHGVGTALHEEPREIPTWYVGHDRRRVHEGLVFTLEPFLSTGAHAVTQADDGWTLVAPRGTMSVQYEHTLVATRNGPLVLTAPH